MNSIFVDQSFTIKPSTYFIYVSCHGIYWDTGKWMLINITKLIDNNKKIIQAWYNFEALDGVATVDLGTLQVPCDMRGQGSCICIFKC